RCWGMNSVGQLGDGTTNDRSTPGAVATALGFTRVESGNAETCGITAGNDLYCWGDLSFITGVSDRSPAPRLIPGGLSFAEVSMGQSTACGRTVGGAAYCWG